MAEDYEVGDEVVLFPEPPFWVKVWHWFGCCPRCRVYSCDEGIGGRCIDCGKIHGWMTREELRKFSESLEIYRGRKLTPDEIKLLDK